MGSESFSPEMSGPRLDIPLPSVEPPSIDSDTSSSRIHAPFNDYENVLDSLKEVYLQPTEQCFQSFRFGQQKELSPFTFRSLHNTTPEPTAGLGNNRSVPVPSAEEPSAIHASVTIVTPQVTNLRTSSAPVQPLVPTQPTKPAKASYDIKNEILPDEPYFGKDFQRVLLAGKSVAQQIGNILGTCDLARDRESQVFSMIQAADELSKFDVPSVCTIGIVGSSGAGKSSLINCLLDEPDLALTAGLGAACTSVVTEYRLRKQEHTAKYTIEIDRMTDAEIKEQLDGLVWSYRYFHICDLDELRITEVEQKALEDKAKLAWDTLKSAFGSREELTKAYLKDTSDGAEERIQQQLKLWTDSLQWPGDSHHGRWIGSAEDVEEYKTKTQQFLTGGLWPFINVIRVFLSSQVLKGGAVLADLPGFHDSNHARVKIAENCMYDCDEIFIVAETVRVATNKIVDTLLKSLERNLKDGKPSQGISLICTKSEDLDITEIRRTFFADGSEKAARVNLLEKIIEEADNNDEMPGAHRRSNNAKDELGYLFLTARSDYIQRLVLSTHVEILQRRPLSVFCVSSHKYRENRQRPKALDLAIKGSGIPLLRQHCLKIPSQAQFRIGYFFLTVRLKSLVQQVQLWLAGDSQETLPNDATVQGLLGLLQGDLKANVSEAIRGAEEKHKSVALDIMIKPVDEKLGVWTRDALAVLGTWENYKPIQIMRFCANNGSWGSEKISYTEWNLELIDSMTNTMSSWWNIYSQMSATIIGDLESSILGLIDRLISQVKDFQGAPLFAESLVTRLRNRRPKPNRDTS